MILENTIRREKEHVLSKLQEKSIIAGRKIPRYDVKKRLLSVLKAEALKFKMLGKFNEKWLRCTKALRNFKVFFPKRNHLMKLLFLNLNIV